MIQLNVRNLVQLQKQEIVAMLTRHFLKKNRPFVRSQMEDDKTDRDKSLNAGDSTWNQFNVQHFKPTQYRK